MWEQKLESVEATAQGFPSLAQPHLHLPPDGFESTTQILCIIFEASVTNFVPPFINCKVWGQINGCSLLKKRMHKRVFPMLHVKSTEENLAEKEAPNSA